MGFREYKEYDEEDMPILLEERNGHMVILAVVNEEIVPLLKFADEGVFAEGGAKEALENAGMNVDHLNWGEYGELLVSSTSAVEEKEENPEEGEEEEDDNETEQTQEQEDE